MRTFALKSDRTPQPAAPRLAKPAARPSPPSQTEEHETESNAGAATLSGHDFSGIPVRPPAARTPAPLLQRLACEPTGRASAAPASVESALAAPGRPLEPTLRREMEGSFGYDFSRVRVHSGAAAAQSARDVNAAAYTVGRDIVFGEDRFAPGTREGARLVAHELTHVIQQQAAPPAGAHGQGDSPQRDVRQVAKAPSALQRQANDPRSLQVVSKEAPRHVRVSQWLTENLPGGGTSRTELYWVDFEVDARGGVRAGVRTVSPDRAYRSGVLRFGQEFQHALEHFERSGVQVTAFEGDWSYMTKDEISENLRVFKEGMAQGMTREKAARNTPTGKVLASAGFEVTHVENVPESQPHLADEGVKRWRVRAIFRRAPPAAVTPPTNVAGGGAAAAGPRVSGAPTEVGTTTKPGGRTPTVPPPRASGRVMSRLGSFGVSAGLALFDMLMQYLIVKGIADFEEKVMQKRLKELQPVIQQAVERAEPDIERVLRETNYRKSVYANIHMDVLSVPAVLHTRSGFSQRWAYAGLHFLGVDVSAQNIQGDDKGQITGSPLTKAVVGQLRVMKMLVGALADRWPIMNEAGGQ